MITIIKKQEISPVFFIIYINYEKATPSASWVTVHISTNTQIITTKTGITKRQPGNTHKSCAIAFFLYPA